MPERKEKITQPLPMIHEPRSGYEEVEEGTQQGIALTREQHQLIDEVARHYDIKWWAAFEMVWNDAFEMLVRQSRAQSTYTELPTIKRSKKIVG